MSKPLNKKKSTIYKIGISSVIVSFIVWISPLLAPFLPLSTKGKWVFTTGALILAELLFWVGAVIVGKEAAMKIKKYLNPRNWKKQKSAVLQQGGEKNEG
ncbi:transporter suffix domain-containing protein [Bacillus taeanensis]|uniref:Transporter suffix domain-containing protein n=1 Tax=Bacillus taeanensis TaxID=273032 RepID=A0A366Y3G8_9BACI|nr:transporter suffix domain-containing protein [Bacillus taeanensis]RBW70924.1 hypothetical protein DS031_02695 [Bacillus taeanensis]